MTRPLIFGVLNVTPDSFSDGGLHVALDAAIAHARALVAEGADWIDVGGESTAPGRAPVTPEEERARILDVIAALAAEGIPASVDTYHASTAEAAVAAGAQLVNDVYGTDPDMPAVVAATGARYVAMHAFGAPTTPHHYADVVAEVRDGLLARVAELETAGISKERIVLDPGIGFSKDPSENWALLRGLPELAATGFPILVGTSRKRFIRRLVGDELADRDLATAVTSSLAAQAGVWGVRVHDVRATRIALDIADEWAGTYAGPADRDEGPGR
jgi:dihydropteroate synthase